MSVFLIPDALAGERVDAAAARITGHSRSRILDLIESGGVELGGARVVKGSQRVAGGELLELLEAPRPPTPVPTARIADGVRIAYEDQDLVVVDKPVGVAAHPSLGWEGPSVTEHLAASGVQVSTSGAAERQGVVQRLDVGTSGLMVVAKSEIAYSVLKQAFRDRSVDKVYHALAQGHPDPFQGTIEAPIGRHPGSDWRMAIVEGGRH
ncbi:MAG TPA: RluA family pseudouridine synthase, partial [Arachnia sp.]|nr:RluA family pseudouridine synthase [Arachnia sp.]